MFAYDIKNLYKNYGLGVGILPDRPDDLIKEMELILNDPTYREKQTSRRKKMLLDKIDVSDFLYNLLDNFPQSVRELKPE